MRTSEKRVRWAALAASAAMAVFSAYAEAADNFHVDVTGITSASGTNTAIVNIDSPVGGAFGSFRADSLFGYLAFSGNGVANRFPLFETANGWYQDTLTIFNTADPSAQTGVLNATIRADQFDVLTGGCAVPAACASSHNTWTIAVDGGPTFNGGNNGGPRSNFYSTSLPIARTFTFGQPFTLRVTMTADAGFSPGGPPGFTSPTATYLFTDRFWWQGISSVTDAQGNVVPYTIRAGSHVDWRVAAVIPEPSALTLMLAGLIAFGRWRVAYGTAR